MWYKTAKLLPDSKDSHEPPAGLDERIKAKWKKDNTDPTNDPKWETGDPNILYLLGWLNSAIERLRDIPEAPVRAIQGLRKFMQGLGFDITSSDKALYDEVIDEFYKKYPHFNKEEIDLQISPQATPIDSSDYDIYIKWGESNKNDKDNINKNLLRDIVSAAKQNSIGIYISRAKSDHAKNTPTGKYESRHYGFNAIDIAGFYNINPDGTKSKLYTYGNNEKEFKFLGDKLVGALFEMGYKNANTGESGKPMAIIWQVHNSAGNHYNHVHVSNTNP
jgi:hypothetical protein